MLLVGLGGSLLTSYILDRTKKFKLITVINTVCFCIFYGLFTKFVSLGSVIKYWHFVVGFTITPGFWPK